jgi:hypothetical protein
MCKQTAWKLARTLMNTSIKKLNKTNKISGENNYGVCEQTSRTMAKDYGAALTKCLPGGFGQG